MANISEFLQKILSARFGEDVRRSIHDAIEEIDKVADTAQGSATAMAQMAENKANEASGYASSAKTSESNAKSYMESTKNSETSAKSSETVAKTSETNAKISETNAKSSENAASDSAVIAQNKASEAEQSASGAANSALSASRSESNANTSAENAKDSENNADYYSKLSKSYAVGETSERPGEDNDNSKYYSETAKTEADRAKAEADRAQRIAGGDYVTNTQIKDYSLIKDTGYELALSIDNSTYLMTISLKNAIGDILSSESIDFPIESMVVNATYQNGKITLILQNGNTVDVDVSALVSGLVKDTFTIAGIDMKDNITASELKVALGLDKVANVAVNDQAPTFTAASSRENIASGEKLSVLFGKIMKWFADLKPHAFSNPTNNLLATVAGTALDAVQGTALNNSLNYKCNFSSDGRIITGSIWQDDSSENLKKLGITYDFTVEQIIDKIKNSGINIVEIITNANITTFNTSLPVNSGGIVTIKVGEGGGRGSIEFTDIRTGNKYIKYAIDGVYGQWEKFITKTDLDNIFENLVHINTTIEINNIGVNSGLLPSDFTINALSVTHLETGRSHVISVGLTCSKFIPAGTEIIIGLNNVNFRNSLSLWGSHPLYDAHASLMNSGYQLRFIYNKEVGANFGFWPTLFYISTTAIKKVTT